MKNFELKSWKTTTIAFSAAFVAYFTQAGFVFPTTKQEWQAAIFAALIAALGAVAKDYDVHSTAPEVEKSTVKEEAREFGKTV